MERLLKSLCFSLVMGCLLCLSSSSMAQAYEPFTLQAQLPGWNSADVSVALDGDTALVQRFNSVDVRVRSGSTWTLQTTLTSPAGTSTGFGGTVELQGNVAVIGNSSTSGRDIYIFNRSGTTWTHTQTLTSPFADDVGCGYRLALDNNTLMVTCFHDNFVPGDDGGLISVGTVDVYVFNGSLWQYQTRLTPAEDFSTYIANYGFSLALKGNLAFIGTPGLDTVGNANGDGAVMIFERSGSIWTQQTTLLSPVDMGYFGTSVAYDGTTLLIGAPNMNGDAMGDAYFYTYNGTNWVQDAMIHANMGMFFGYHVAISGDIAIISPNAQFPGTGGTHVYHHEGSNWVDRQILTRPDGTELGSRGKIALSGNTTIIPWADPVYVFVSSPAAQEELLVNGSFELDTNGDAIPDGWTQKNPAGDGRRCNQPGQTPVAYIGNCAYLFKEDASGSNKLIQNVDLNVHDLNAGDKIKLTGFYNKPSSGDIQVRVFVSYSSLPEDQARITVTKMTSGYKAFPSIAMTLKAKPTRVRVQIQNQTTSGKTWFDDMSLKLTHNSTNAAVMPLPLPAQP